MARIKFRQQRFLAMKGILAKLLRTSVKRASEEHLLSKTIRLPASLSDLPAPRRRALEEMVILGVLMVCVAHADDDFSKAEERQMAKVLTRWGGLDKNLVGLVLAASHEAKQNRPDIQGFTREVAKKPYSERVHVIEHLFRIAYVDGKLHAKEREMVRQIAKLSWVRHKDFIEAKLFVQKEMGLARH